MDSNQRPCRVAPLEAFSDDLAPDGRGARTRREQHAQRHAERRAGTDEVRELGYERHSRPMTLCQ